VPGLHLSGHDPGDGVVLGVEADGLPGHPPQAGGDAGRLHHRALGGQVAVQDGDAILISNAPFAQSHKVLSTFSGVLTTARSATALTP
jgi:polysaccharide export outer membrane protein